MNKGRRLLSKAEGAGGAQRAPFPSMLQPPSAAVPHLCAASFHFSEWPTHWLDIFPSYWCYRIITFFSCNDICVCSRLLWRSDSRTRGHPCTPLGRGCCDIRRRATTQETLRQRAVTSAAFPTDLCVLQVLMTFHLSLSCSLKSPMREACFENASSWTSQSSLDMLSFLKVYNVYY